VRIAASKGFVKSLGFAKLVRTEGSQKYEARPLEGPLPRGPQPPHYRDVEEGEEEAAGDEEDADFEREGPRLAAADHDEGEELLLPAYDLGGPAYAAAAAAAAAPAGPGARGPGTIRYTTPIGSIDLPAQLPYGMGPAPRPGRGLKPELKRLIEWGLEGEPFTRGAAEQSDGEVVLRRIAEWAEVPIGRKGPRAIRTTILRKVTGNAS